MMKEEKNKNKWNNNGTWFVLLKKVDSIHFHPKIELIEGMTPDETWSCFFTNTKFDMLVEQTQFYAMQEKGNHNFYPIRSKVYQFIGLSSLDTAKYLKRGIIGHPKDKR